jgi:hypothetical protein
LIQISERTIAAGEAEGTDAARYANTLVCASNKRSKGSANKPSPTPSGADAHRGRIALTISNDNRFNTKQTDTQIDRRARAAMGGGIG